MALGDGGKPTSYARLKYHRLRGVAGVAGGWLCKVRLCAVDWARRVSIKFPNRGSSMTKAIITSSYNPRYIRDLMCDGLVYSSKPCSNSNELLLPVGRGLER